MPDIQTELQKIMQAWEQPETTQQPPKDTPMFTKTIGVSEATFNIVRDQPGLSKRDYVKELTKAGYKKTSTTALLNQMERRGHIWEDVDGLLHARLSEYRPLGAGQARKKVAAKKYKTKDVPVPEGIAALVEEHKDRVQEIMNTISLPDAKRLHNALSTYFGVL